MKTSVLVEHDADGQLDMEHCLAAKQAFTFMERPVFPCHANDLANPWAYNPPHADHPVVGSVQAIQGYFAAHGLKVPQPLNIPKELERFAASPQRTMTYAEFLLDKQLPVFVKPALEHKLFSGGEISQHDTKVLALDMCKPDTLLLVADPVVIETEYRIFIGPGGKIEAMRHYMGDPFILPRLDAVKMMIELYKPAAPIAYSLDVGVLDNGRTVVVECNDFWALGTYGMDPYRYAELVELRWRELCS